MSNAGFLGPDSIAWRVHSDPSGLVGGIRSLMVQALEPRAMAGVAHHSEFRVDFWGRLRRTNDWLMTVIYGTRADAEQASAVVRAVHSRITGFDHFTKREYRADEPELLIWVHNATVESYLQGYRRHGPDLSGVDADQYVAEMRVLGVLMGVDESELPNDEQGLRDYFSMREPQLAASPDAKEATRILLNPEMPAHLKPLWTLPANDAYASLPRRYQKLYGLPWAPPLGLGFRASTYVMLRAFKVLLPPPPIVEEARRRAGDAAWK